LPPQNDPELCQKTNLKSGSVFGGQVKPLFVYLEHKEKE